MREVNLTDLRQHNISQAEMIGWAGKQLITTLERAKDPDEMQLLTNILRAACLIVDDNRGDPQTPRQRNVLVEATVAHSLECFDNAQRLFPIIDKTNDPDPMGALVKILTASVEIWKLNRDVNRFFQQNDFDVLDEVRRVLEGVE